MEDGRYYDDDERYMQEEDDDLVFFMQDSDDEEEEEEEDYDDEQQQHYKEKPKSPVIRQLKPELVAQMQAANEGRLNWVGFINETIDDDDDNTEFPPIDTTPIKKDRHSRRITTKVIPMNMRVDYITTGPSEIKFKVETTQLVKKPTMCRFVRNGEQCPYGDTCLYTHIPPLCNTMKNGNVCMRGPTCRYRHLTFCKTPDCKGCDLFHPKPEDLEKLRAMKTRFCRNKLLNKPCEAGDECRFAHRLDQVQAVVEHCKPDKQCKLVHTVKKTVNGITKIAFKNTQDKICWKLHSNETISNFVARTSGAKLNQ